MSYAGSFFSAVTSIVSTVTTSVVSIPQKVLAAGGRFNAHNLATPVVKSKAELLSVGSYGVSILWAIGAFLVTAILWTLLPLILGFLNSVFSGFKKFLNYYLVSTESSNKARFITRYFLLVIRVIPVIIGAFIKHVILFIIAHIVAILSTFIFAFLFIFLVERHLNWSVAFVSIVADLGVAGYNLGGGAFEIISQILNFVNPLVNASIKYSAIISIHIYDGIVYTQEHFGLPLGSGNGRRLLSDTSALGYSETLMAGLEPFMELVLIVCEAILVISTAVIDIFFEIGLLSFLGYFLVIAVLVITKVICIFAGGWCTLLEIADFFVNTLVLGLFNLIANAFGQSIPKIPIACVASQLAAAGSQCAGSVFSIDPPGFFSGLLNQRRLLSVSCDEVGGVFRESFGDTHVHETNNKSLACPHARSSFHPYGHALNMASLNTHDCYEVCVNRVKYEACENGEQYFIGTCGPIARKNITIVQARRRLDDFFNMNTFLKDREMVSKVNEMYSTPVTRFEAVDMLKNLIGFKFSLGGLQCDLTQSPTNIQEIVVDAGCLIGKFWSIQQTKQKNGGRRLEEANLINMVNIDEIRHKARMWKTHVTEYDHHPAHAEVNKSPLFQLKTGLQRHHTVERSSTSFKPVNIPRMEKSTVFAHGFVRIPTNIQGRRRLEALIECPVGERLCANMINCVTDYSQCPDAHSYSVITWVVYHFEKATISLETFNLPFVVKSLIDCFRLYESNPETDPLAIGSLTKSETDRINECVWCFPMLPPYTYSHQVAVFSLRDVIAATCNSYSNQYKSCQCPMFFDLPENSVPLTMFMDEDLGYIVANCLIFYKNLWIFVVGDWIGLFWSTIFPEPFFPTWFSRFFSLYSHDIPISVYYFCQGIHIGYAFVGIIIAVCIIQLFKMTYTVYMFILTQSTTSERTKYNMLQWMNYNRTYRAAMDSSGAVGDIQNRLDAQEGVINELQLNLKQWESNSTRKHL